MQKRPFLISLFLFAVISLLAVVAFAFPRRGIAIGGLQLQFPNIDDYIKPPVDTRTALRGDTVETQVIDTLPLLTAEEMMEMREQERAILEYQAYFNTSKECVHLPILTIYDTLTTAIIDTLNPTDTLWQDSIITHRTLQYDYFNALFAALEGADSLPINIAHYGDSQLEEDRMTMILRDSLQQRFGGGGVGTMPLYQPVPRRTISQQTNPEPQRYAVFFNNLKRTESNHYGALGQVAVVQNPVTVSFSPRSKQPAVIGNQFNCVSLYCRPELDNQLSLTIGNKTARSTQTGTQIITLELSDSTKRFTATVDGKGDVYGIRLHNTTGVSVDNIPMRGCSGTIFSKMDANDLSLYFTETRTRLIIMQFGGNTVPHLYNDKRVETYAETLVSQVRFMQRLAPDAIFLFIGPTDMTTTQSGQHVTYPRLAMLDATLCQKMTEVGIAYWSMFEAMGGEGAMQEWVNSGLAGHDYVHFTRKGAEKMGSMLTNAILKLYEYYQIQNINQSVYEPESETYAPDCANP